MQETRKRRLLRTAAVPIGLLAAGALVFAGSQSAFTATTDNAGNTWSAGKVVLKNNGGKATAVAGVDFAVNSTPAAFPATGGGVNLAMKPGATDSRCIVVENTSDWATPVKFYFTNVDGAFTAPGTAKLSTELLVKVEFDPNSRANCTGFTSSGTIFGGTGGAVMPTSGVGTTYATGFGTWTPAGGSATYGTYKITWTLPSTATNAVQNSTATATFNWEQQLA